DTESVRFSINKNFDLWRIDVQTGEQSPLTTNPGPDVSPRISPDGQTVAYLSVPRKGPHSDIYNLAVAPLAAGGLKWNEALFNHHGSNAKDAPHPSPAFPLPDNCWVGNQAVVYAAPMRTVNK